MITISTNDLIIIIRDEQKENKQFMLIFQLLG